MTNIKKGKLNNFPVCKKSIIKNYFLYLVAKLSKRLLALSAEA